MSGSQWRRTKNRVHALKQNTSPVHPSTETDAHAYTFQISLDVFHLFLLNLQIMDIETDFGILFNNVRPHGSEKNKIYINKISFKIIISTSYLAIMRLVL